MNILIIDPEKKANYRISKDTSGGYGTGNNFGHSLIPRLLMKLIKKFSDWPPLFVAYTFSVLKSKGHNVEYKKELPRNVNSYDLFIVVSSIVCCETEIKEIKKIKSYGKKVFVIGPFATNMPKMYTEAGGVVISGEPEFYFLLKDKFEEDLNKEVVLFNHSFSLDDLPYPSWDEVLFNLNKVNKLFGNYKSVPLLATRGCPYSCSRYCVYPLQQGSKVRQRDVKKIVDEMEYWSKKFKVKMFIFRDPVFSINKKHTIEFCNELYKRKLDIKFMIETHLRILDSELIALLKKSGLKAVKVGVESADTDVMKAEKRYTVSQDQQLIKIRELEENNIQVSSMFIIGFPSDNEESIWKTINYAISLNTTYAQFSIWTPYPGTPVFEEYKNKITNNNFENFDQYSLVYQHSKFNSFEVRNFLDKAYSKDYSRISWFLKYFKSFLYA